MQIEAKDEKLIDLKKLCELLLVKGIASAKKWCDEANIKIIEIGNKMVVPKFMVDIELDRHLVKNLKKKYPTKWIELYRCYKEKDHLGYLSLLEDGEINPSNTLVRVKPVSERAKRLAKNS